MKPDAPSSPDDCDEQPLTSEDWLFCGREITEKERQALEAYSRGEMTALALRRRLGGATYGEVLRLLSEEALPLPRAPVEGREEQLERARAWMFPRKDVSC